MFASCFVYLPFDTFFDKFFIQFLFVQATIQICFHIITVSIFTQNVEMKLSLVSCLIFMTLFTMVSAHNLQLQQPQSSFTFHQI